MVYIGGPTVKAVGHYQDIRILRVYGPVVTEKLRPPRAVITLVAAVDLSAVPVSVAGQ